MGRVRRWLARNSDRRLGRMGDGFGESAISLDPLIGAYFLSDLGTRMAKSGLFYVHSMGDILVLAPTRRSCAEPSGP